MTQHAIMSPASPVHDGRLEGHLAFQTTHWSVILTARDQDGTAAQEALASLCSSYWYPLYAFVRRYGHGPQDAEDLTQEFFYRFLDRNWLGSVRPTEGKFRSFLLACLKHFLAKERQRANAQRRGSGRAAIPLDGKAAETRYLSEPPDKVTPEVLFERHWALAVLERTFGLLQQEYVRRGKGELFEGLKGFLPAGQDSTPRLELADRYGMSANALDVAIHRLRQRFGALLREELAQTVSSPAEAEEELRHLIAVLGE